MDLGKTTGELMKGIGGSLRNMGGLRNLVKPTPAAPAAAPAAAPVAAPAAAAAAPSEQTSAIQINAAREWLANIEGRVTAASPPLGTTPADEPPAVNLGVDDAVGGDKAAAPRSPLDLGKATGDLMKGIGGSLRTVGGALALFGANKSTQPSSPGEPEKPKMPESSSV